MCSHAPGRGLLPVKGLPVKDAARIAHLGLAVRLKERARTGAIGVPLPPNFFCMPFSALHAPTGSYPMQPVRTVHLGEACITPSGAGQMFQHKYCVGVVSRS